MKYDKNLFIKNIYVLAKDKKIKIGELEANCNVSTGYFARFRQVEGKSAPGADVLMNAADQLSVSVDALLSFDFTQATEPEKKLQNFLAKLRLETETRKLHWQQEAPVAPHPLLVSSQNLMTEEEKAQDELPDDVSVSVLQYRSVFRPDLNYLPPVALYRCFFPEKRILYLAAAVRSDKVVPGQKNPVDLELVMLDPRVPDPLPLVRMDHEGHGCLDMALDGLLTVVKKAISLPALMPEVETIIDDYLN